MFHLVQITKEGLVSFVGQTYRLLLSPPDGLVRWYFEEVLHGSVITLTQSFWHWRCCIGPLAHHALGNGKQKSG